MKQSETQLSDLTGMARLTVRRKLSDIPHERGPKSAKLYDSKIALPILYGIGESGGLSQAEANRLLTIARREEIDLNMEVTRRERIPIEDVTLINEEALSNIAGLLKAHTGKTLNEQLVNDIFANARAIGAKLRDLAK